MIRGHGTTEVISISHSFQSVDSWTVELRKDRVHHPSAFGQCRIIPRTAQNHSLLLRVVAKTSFERRVGSSSTNWPRIANHYPDGFHKEVCWWWMIWWTEGATTNVCWIYSPSTLTTKASRRFTSVRISSHLYIVAFKNPRDHWGRRNLLLPSAFSTW